MALDSNREHVVGNAKRALFVDLLVCPKDQKKSSPLHQAKAICHTQEELFVLPAAEAVRPVGRVSLSGCLVCQACLAGP